MSDTKLNEPMPLNDEERLLLTPEDENKLYRRVHEAIGGVYSPEPLTLLLTRLRKATRESL